MERRSDREIQERRRRWFLSGGLALLLGVGLFPVGWIDRAAATAVGWLSLPHRGVGALETWAFGGGLESDPNRLALARESEAELRRRELSSAIAGKEELRQRGGVVATVERRENSDATYRINRGRLEGVLPGQPVTQGDVFAGIVASSQEHQATVYFPWHRAVRLCARTLEDQSSRAVVAGAGEGTMRVVVSQLRPLREGVEVEVASSPEAGDLESAVGFRIGVLRLGLEGLAPTVEVDPNIRADRILQVIVRTPAAHSSGVPMEAPTRWERVALSPAGDATPGRATALATSLPAGAIRLEGAALALDQWLLGRVGRVGGGSARVRFVEDPGFTVSAILLGKEGPPIPLRRLRTIRSSARGVVFLPIDGLLGVGPDAEGVLVTGAGDPAVPKGLRLGTVRIQGGQIILERELPSAAVREAFVFVAEERS